MSETVYGLGAGTFFIGYLACGVPSNLILQRLGARRWVAIMMISWGLLSTGLMFVRTPAGFYTLRLLTGAAEAGFFPVQVIEQVADEQERDQPQQDLAVGGGHAVRLRQGPGGWGHRTLQLRGRPGEPDAAAPAPRKG